MTTDRFAFGAFCEALLESVPDGVRDVAASELVACAAAQLTALVGAKAAATQHHA